MERLTPAVKLILESDCSATKNFHGMGFTQTL
jgi:hypothetical protein